MLVFVGVAVDSWECEDGLMSRMVMGVCCMSWRSRAENISVKTSTHFAKAVAVVIALGPR